MKAITLAKSVSLTTLSALTLAALLVSTAPTPKTSAWELQPVPSKVWCAKHNDFKDINVGNAMMGQRKAAELMGWTGDEWTALLELWSCESRWHHHALNKDSCPQKTAEKCAYGIPQSFPGEKMAGRHANWKDSPDTQAEWGLTYIKNRYGTPQNARAFFNANNSY